METSDTKIQEAIRRAEGILAEAFMDAFPRHYMISQRVLGDAEDTEPYLRKLGRFLLRYDQELGESPAVTLKRGGSEQLLRVLAGRANLDPDSIRIITLPNSGAIEEANPDPKPVFLAYCDYHATGEGVTLMVGAGNTQSSALDAFLRHTPEFYHRGLTEDSLDESSPPETLRAARLLPDAMTDLIASLPRGAPQFYARLHYNLA